MTTISPDVVAAWVNSPEFLQSYHWRRVRMEILKERGARCDACGATRADGVVMNVDHIRPRRTHPELALDKSNLQVLCGPCNHGKGSWDDTDWRRVTSVAREPPVDPYSGPPSWWWNLSQADIDLASEVFVDPEILHAEWAVGEEYDSAEKFRSYLLLCEAERKGDKALAETIARTNP